MTIELPNPTLTKIGYGSRGSSQQVNDILSEIEQNFTKIKAKYDALEQLSNTEDNDHEKLLADLRADINALRSEINTKAEAINERNVSPIASNVMSQGEVSITDTVRTKNFAVVKYKGDGQSPRQIETGISSVDFTKPNNGSGYWLDRLATNPFVRKDYTVTGSNLISNGTFDTNYTGWTSVNNPSVTAGGGKVTINWINTSEPFIYQAVTTEVGKRYILSYKKTGEKSGIWISTTSETLQKDAIGIAEVSTDEPIIFIAKTSITYVKLGNNTGGNTPVTFDNISLKEISGGEEVESGEVKVNLSKVHFKNLDTSHSHQVYDGLRGSGRLIYTDTTSGEESWETSLLSFGSNGVSIGNNPGINGATNSIVCYQTLYTHVKWGLTNHGKLQVEAYNPITKECMIYYEGSGNKGHKLSHSLDVSLDWGVAKRIDVSQSWYATTSLYKNGEFYLERNGAMYLNGSSYMKPFRDVIDVSPVGPDSINSEGSYILYGKAKSETWTIIKYQGTGGKNRIIIEDVNHLKRKPSRFMMKRTDSTSDWTVVDSKRLNFENQIYLNLSSIEGNDTSNSYQVGLGYIDMLGYGTASNAKGGSYILLVEFDTGDADGDSWFDMPSDTSKLNFSNAVFNYTTGKDEQGFVNSAESFNSTLELTQNETGKYWLAKNKGLSTFELLKDKPIYGQPSGDAWEDNGKIFFDIDTGITKHIKYSGLGSTKDILDIFGDGSCIACYPLRGDASDLGNNYNGSLNGKIAFINGRFGKTLVWNEETAYVSLSEMRELFYGEDWEVCFTCSKPTANVSTVYYEPFRSRDLALEWTSKFLTFALLNGGTVAKKAVRFEDLSELPELLFISISHKANTPDIDITINGRHHTNYTVCISEGGGFNFHSNTSIGYAGTNYRALVGATICQIRRFSRQLSNEERKVLYHESLALTKNEETKEISLVKNPVDIVIGIPQKLDTSDKLPENTITELKVSGHIETQKLTVNNIPSHKLKYYTPPRPFITSAQFGASTDVVDSFGKRLNSTGGNNSGGGYGLMEGVVTGAFSLTFELSHIWGWAMVFLVPAEHADFINLNLNAGNMRSNSLGAIYNNSSNNLCITYGKGMMKEINQVKGFSSGIFSFTRDRNDIITVHRPDNSETVIGAFSGDLCVYMRTQAPAWVKLLDLRTW